MIVVISPSGSSFKGLGTYLTHDPKADSDERVAWTHTLNLANDDVPSAVNEMLWTAREAELLKQEAGIRAGGRSTENPVKHISLNWSPEDDPSREHMIKTSEEFLHHMKWQEHQAVLIAHQDKKYAHVHVMLNAVHPETGLHLDENFERRRAQKWAAGYERENGKIYCEERLKDPREREDSPPRGVWMAFVKSQQEFERVENAHANFAEKNADEKNTNISNFDEWKILKDFQRRERQEFFAGGKQAFSELRSSIYAEVREEFRGRWAEYHADRRGGVDDQTLAATKAEIIAEQRETLALRRDEACLELRESRDAVYQGLLEEQRQTRGELRGRQEEGWDNSVFLGALGERVEAFDRAAMFREAAAETTMPERSDASSGRTNIFEEAEEDSPSAPGYDLGSAIAIHAGFGAASAFGIAFRAFEGSSLDDRPRSASDRNQVFLQAAETTSKREQHEQEEADAAWRRRQLALPGE